MISNDQNFKKLRNMLGKQVIIKCLDRHVHADWSDECYSLDYGMVIKVTYNKGTDGILEVYAMLDNERTFKLNDIIEIYPATELGRIVFGE